MKVMVNLDNATFIGESEWVKDSAYQVHKLDGKYYTVIVNGYNSREIDEDSIREIKEEDVSNYI